MRLALATLLLAGCFPSKHEEAELVCGEGTHEEDGACVADAPTGDSGDPTGEGEGEGDEVFSALAQGGHGHEAAAEVLGEVGVEGAGPGEAAEVAA